MTHRGIEADYWSFDVLVAEQMLLMIETQEEQNMAYALVDVELPAVERDTVVIGEWRAVAEASRTTAGFEIRTVNSP